MRPYPLVTILALGLCVSSCSTGSHLRPAERQVLQGAFGDSREPVPLDRASTLGRACRGDSDALHQLFVKSLDPTLDGEYAETHTHYLTRVLFELGDHRFATALRAEPQGTRDAVLQFLSPVFAYYHLSYPDTESLSSDPVRLRSGLPVEPPKGLTKRCRQAMPGVKGFRRLFRVVAGSWDHRVGRSVRQRRGGG